MSNRRRAARRDPIEIDTADGREFVARPLPWMNANDLGNELVRQNLEATNDLIKMYVSDEGAPQLEMQFQKKITDWQTPLKMAYPDVKDALWHTPHDLSSDECADLILASLDVNHLEHLRHLVDPNFPTPLNLGGMSSSETAGETGMKIPSTPDSDSQVSPEQTPSN